MIDEYLYIDTDKTEELININDKLVHQINYTEGKADVIYFRGQLAYDRAAFSEAIELFNKSIILYKQVKQDKGVSYSLNGIGNSYYSQGDLEKAIEFYEKSRIIDESLNDLKGVSGSYLNIGNIYADQGDYEKALSTYEKAIKIKKEINDTYDLGLIYFNVGIVHFEQGNYPKALINFQESAYYFKIVGREKSNINVLNAISTVYLKQNKLDKALASSEKAIEIIKTENLTIQLPSCLLTLGEIYEEKLLFDSAFVCYNDALQISNESNTKPSIANSLNHLASLHLLNGNTSKALLNYQSALYIYKELQFKLGLCESQFGLAKVYFSNKDYEKALQYVLESQKTANQLNLLEFQKETSKLLSDIYSALGNYKEALINYKSYNTFDDSIFNKKNIQKIAELEYEFIYMEQIKDAEIREVKLIENVKTTKVELKASQKNTFIAIIVILICLIVIGGLMFYFKLRNVRTENQKIIIEQKLLRSQMTPHFIFNSLAVLQGMILNNENEESVNYLSKFSKLLRIVLENYRNKMVLLKDELEAINNYIALQNFDINHPINFRVQVDEDIELEQLKIPPMLIQPFIENTIIHAFNDSIKDRVVDLKINFINSTLTCTVIDNGIGIDKEKTNNILTNKKSLATVISSERMEILSKELKMKGTVTIGNRKDTNGTIVTLIIPYLKK